MSTTEIEALTSTAQIPIEPSQSQDYPTETPLPTPVLTATEEKTQEPINQTPSYTLQVNFDYNHQFAEVYQNIAYTNTANKPLDDILLAVDPLRQPDCFALSNLQINGVEQNNYEEGDYWIKIPLSAPLVPLSSISIDLNYAIQLPSISNPLPDQKPGIFGYTILQSNFVDWYPFIPPLSESGEWVLHDPWFFGEYLVYDLADFFVTITLNNAPENTLIAASAQNLSTEKDVFYYEHTQARNFVWSASPSYILSSKEIDGIIVNSYYFVFNQAAGEQALTETVQAVEQYQEWFGPYPHQILSIVEADFLDGMEYDGLYFLSKGFYNLYDGTPQGYLTMIAVHETAHQWWYTKIANDQALEPWLDEALCTYTELLYYEKFHPEYVDWWWNYRINYYQPGGMINLSIYDYPSFVSYRDATYLQGANFFNQLRTILGDETFFQFLKTYANQNAGKISSAQSFWKILSGFDSDAQTKIIGNFFKQ